jgi:hypothetical protein
MTGAGRLPSLEGEGEPPQLLTEDLQNVSDHLPRGPQLASVHDAQSFAERAGGSCLGTMPWAPCCNTSVIAASSSLVPIGPSAGLIRVFDWGLAVSLNQPRGNPGIGQEVGCGVLIGTI